MGWKTAVWGSENASPDTKRRLVVVFVILALTIFGLRVDFVSQPALALDRCLLWILIAGCALPVGMLLFPGERARIFQRMHTHGRLTVVVGLLSLIPFFGFACWVIFAITLPWTYTTAFGKPFLTTEIMQTDHRWSRYSCDWNVKGALLGNLGVSYFCISESDYQRHPDERVHVILMGKRSVFGWDIQGVIVADTKKSSTSAATFNSVRR
jgi:hypothetical protein